MDNILIIVVIGLIVGLAVGYIYNEKKRGVKCIGCPEGCGCFSGCSGGCNGCGNKTT